MTQKEIKEIKDRAVESSGNIPMIDVLKVCGYTGKIKRRGNNIYFECLNGCEDDGNMSRCSINESKNLAYCFTCKKGWGPALLASEMLNIKYVEAALLLAKGAGTISQEEYDSCTLSKVRYNKLMSDNTTFKLIENKKAEEEAEYKAPSHIVDIVYRHMLKMKEFSLSTKAKNYLIDKRGLSMDKIVNSQFFSYTEFFSVDRLVMLIKNSYPDFTYDLLRGVPGFYFEFVDSEHKRGKWKFHDPYTNCLGIPLKDSEGKIVALQMRYLEDVKLKNGTSKTNKYFFVTSKYEFKSGKDVAYGSSPGTPAHVEYPPIITNSMFLIGEGVFKMMEAAKEGSVSFSCQGVGNYKYVVDEIDVCIKSDTLKQHMSKKLLERKEELKFVIMYDSDMFRNYSVLLAACDLCMSLVKRYKKMPSFLIWDEEYGKGFDDMKKFLTEKGYNYKSFCFLIDGERFVKMAREVIKQADKKFKGTVHYRSTKYDSLYSLFIYQQLWVNQIEPLYEEAISGRQLHLIPQLA